MFYRNAFVPRIMSRNRFQSILKFIHFSNNEEAVGGNKLHKIQPLVDKLLHNFEKTYTPGPVLAVDESIVPFRGRLSFRQYLKQKAHPYGVKVFKLCSNYGFTHNLQIYCGRVRNKSGCVSENVVLDLTNSVINSGRTIVTDNWYTSLSLARTLLAKRTHLVGTIRSNRQGVPRFIVNEKLRKSEFVSMMNSEGITITHWKDKRSVFVLSTKHGLDASVIRKRNKYIVKPSSVVFYNKGKKFVDVSDQMGSYASPLRKSIKWYRKLSFDLLLNVSVVNAWIIYQETRNEIIPLTRFRKHLVEQLLLSTSEQVETSEEATPRRAVHKLTRLDGSRSNYKTRRQCRACYRVLSAKFGSQYARNRARKVVTFCADCPDNPFYCLSCFNRDHKI